MGFVDEQGGVLSFGSFETENTEVTHTETPRCIWFFVLRWFLSSSRLLDGQPVFKIRGLYADSFYAEGVDSAPFWRDPAAMPLNGEFFTADQCHLAFGRQNPA